MESRYKENIRALESLGVRIEGPASPYPERIILPVPGQQPAELALRGLHRVHALVLFRNMHQFLNVRSKSQNLLAPLELMDDEGLAELDREDIIDIRTPLGQGEDNDFGFHLWEEEPAKFDLEVGKGEMDEDIEALRMLIARTFLAVMNTANLIHASLDPEAAVQGTGNTPEEENIITGTTKALSSANRLSSPPRVSLLASAERKQVKADADELKFMLDIFGVEGTDKVKTEALAALWKSRGRDHVSIVDLYMYMVRRKTEIREDRSAMPRNDITDVFEYAKVFHDALALRRQLEDKSIESLINNLGIKPVDARSFFMLSDSELTKLRIRLVGWLASLPSMSGYRSQIKEITRQGKTVTSTILYQEAINHLEAQRDVLGHQFDPESWGTFGEVEYRREITDDRSVFNDKLNFIENALILAKYVFTDETMDQYLAK